MLSVELMKKGMKMCPASAAIAAGAGLSFLGIYGQIPVTTPGTYLSVFNIGTSMASSRSQLFHGGYAVV